MKGPTDEPTDAAYWADFVDRLERRWGDHDAAQTLAQALGWFAALGVALDPADDAAGLAPGALAAERRLLKDLRRLLADHGSGPSERSPGPHTAEVRKRLADELGGDVVRPPGQLSPFARAVLRRELATVLRAIRRGEAAARAIGTARRVTNAAYSWTGRELARVLREFHVPRPAGEAARILWHAGARLLTGEADVLHPYSCRSRTPGKAAADALERQAADRWATAPTELPAAVLAARREQQIPAVLQPPTAGAVAILANWGPELARLRDRVAPHGGDKLPRA